MDLLRWGRSPWGEWVLTHVSWSLFWASLFAGVLFFVAHASYMLFSAHRKRTSAETDALEAQFKSLPPKIERHNLSARLFHWIMAAAMFVLLFTAFLPIAGVKFAWVQWHWIAGLVLMPRSCSTSCTTFFLDFWSIWVGPGHRAEGCSASSAASQAEVRQVPRWATGSITAIVFAGLGASITGALMIPRIRTSLVARNPCCDRRGLGHHLCDARSRRCRPRGARHRTSISPRPESGGSRVGDLGHHAAVLGHHEPSRWPVTKGSSAKPAGQA
jgi:hypothetical protein